MLLSHKDIDINLRGKFGLTAVLAASANGHIGVVDLLLRRPELNLTAVGSDGRNLLHIAVQKGQVSVVRQVVALCPNLAMAEDGRGETPLHLASKLGRADMTKLILRRFSR